VRYATADGRLLAELWGKNLSDEFREASTFALATARTLGVTYLPPRTYGVTVGYRF
jgi:iron complex outermembrane recepter protein